MIYINEEDKERRFDQRHLSQPQDTAIQDTQKRDWSDPELINKPAASWFLPDDYFDKRKEEENLKLEERKKKELGRLKASAIADTLRLFGNAAQISRGAYENPWKNEQIETGFKNLDRYNAENAIALDKLKNMELANQEAKFRNAKENERYQNQQELIADERSYQRGKAERAEEMQREQFEFQKQQADRNFELGQRRLDIEEKYKEGSVNARQTAADASAERARNAGQPKSNVNPDKLVQATDPSGREFSFNIDKENDREAIAQMARQYMSDAKNKDAMAQWEAKNSPEWKALNNLLNKKWERDAVSAIMPYILRTDIADQFEISSEQKESRRQQQDPNIVGPQAPQQGDDPLVGIYNQMQSQQAASGRTTQPKETKVTYNSASQLKSTDKGRLINAPWASLSRDDRSKKMYLRIGELTGWNGSQYKEIDTSKLPESQRNKLENEREKRRDQMAKELTSYYYYNEPEVYVIIEKAAKMRGLDMTDIIRNMVDGAISTNTNPEELLTIDLNELQ